MVRWFFCLTLLLAAVSCAKRPADTDAGSAYDRWLAAHTEQEALPDDADPVGAVEDDETMEEEPDKKDSAELEPDISDFDYVEEMPEYDLDMVEEEKEIEPDADVDADCTLVCTTDTCEDPCSGLVWQHEANYSGPQANSASFCAGLTDFGGYPAWRLPTIAELKTLRRGCDTDSGCSDGGGCYWDANLAGACDKGHWSATSAGGGTYYAVEFRTGKVVSVPETTNLFVRCVVSNR